MKVKYSFLEDEANTRQATVLLLHIGGGHSEQKGIHSWHIDPSKKTLYLPVAEDRQEIGLVRVISNGEVTNYAPEGMERKPEDIADSEMRVMDCIDCHNRPTHIYEVPGPAMDAALSSGKIDPSLPYIKMIGVRVLTEAGDFEKPAKPIVEAVLEAYEADHPEVLKDQQEAVRKAAAEIEAIYKRNVFPDMKVTWGTYPTNLGHTDSPGCYRCHDDNHESPAGDTISQEDCTSCHTVLAWNEENPEILATLGME
jgi:hypothetical protein